MQPDCLPTIEIEPEPLPSNPSIPAGWIVLFLVITVAVFEIWALSHDKDTISRMIQRIAKSRRWLKVLGVIGMGILTWHILWGFPW